MTLSPLTVVVGSNASGKTSLLDAITFALDPRSFGGNIESSRPLRLLQAAQWRKNTENRLRPWLSLGSADPRIEVGLTTRGQSPEAASASSNFGVRLKLGDELEYLVPEELVEWDPSDEAKKKVYEQALAEIGAAIPLRLDANVLRQPTPVHAGGSRLGPDGSGLAAVLRDLRDLEDGTFDRIQECLTRLVPSVRKLRCRIEDFDLESGPVPASVVEAKIGERDDDWCPASALSEGTLLVLAILAAVHRYHDGGILLLDDIDRGLHPRAQLELVRLLRELQKDKPKLQVIGTTHSPYIVDAFAPDEVVVLRLDQHAHTRARLLHDHPDLEQWKSMMDAGVF